MSYGDATPTFQLDIEAEPLGGYRIVAVLRDHGLKVHWHPPIEERGIDVPQVIVMTILAWGGTDQALDAALDEIKTRWPQIKAKVHLRDPDAPPPPAE